RSPGEPPVLSTRCTKDFFIVINRDIIIDMLNINQIYRALLIVIKEATLIRCFFYLLCIKIIKYFKIYCLLFI
ncbi:MAG TPA: hypothetical protein DIU45_10485, partial [Clostridium sp.]|nr:hypothetical protein [Clostridium sp.]